MKGANHMRTIKQGLTVLGGALLILSFGASASAKFGSAVPDPEAVITMLDPKARGVLYSGPLTIYYEVTVRDNPQKPNDVTGCDANSEMTNMHFFVSLSNGKTLWAFGGLAENICYVDFAAQETAFADFITNTVIPVIAPGATWALKSAENLAQDGDGIGNTPGTGTPADPFFLNLDIVIAVQ